MPLYVTMFAACLASARFPLSVFFLGPCRGTAKARFIVRALSYAPTLHVYVRARVRTVHDGSRERVCLSHARVSLRLLYSPALAVYSRQSRRGQGARGPALPASLFVWTPNGFEPKSRAAKARFLVRALGPALTLHDQARACASLHADARLMSLV